MNLIARLDKMVSNWTHGTVMRVTDSLGGFFDKRLWHSVGSSRKTTAGVEIDEWTAMNMAAVSCATQVYAGTCSSLPFPLYKEGSKGREKAKDHPLYDMLNVSPNPDMTAATFRAEMWQHQINYGNAYAEIEREGNDPQGELVALWPLHPTRVTPKRDDNDNLYFEVKDDAGQHEADVPPWRMLHIPSIITCNGIGSGVITRARETIGGGIGAEAYANNWFGGGGVPQAVMEHQGNWNQEQREAFRKEWDELYSGPKGRRVAVLGGGATLKPLSFTAQDSQFLESRQFTIEEIARWYNIPPHLLHHLLRATFNNVEELGINFVRYSLVPWLTIWEQCVSQKLLRPKERRKYFAEHTVEGLLRGNHSSRGEWYKAMTGSAIMTRGECRALENLPRVDGDDVFLVQGAVVPLDEEGKPQSEFAGTTGAEPVPPVNDQNKDDGREDTIQNVKTALHRVIAHDLTRFLTKEAKAMANFASKPAEFVSKVDEFYVKQAVLLRDELTETFGALASCGAEADTDLFITSWATEGKTLVIEASGTAFNADELKAAVQAVIESRTWTERPIRAVESVKTAKKMAKIEAA